MFYLAQPNHCPLRAPLRSGANRTQQAPAAGYAPRRNAAPPRTDSGPEAWEEGCEVFAVVRKKLEMPLRHLLMVRHGEHFSFLANPFSVPQFRALPLLPARREANRVEAACREKLGMLWLGHSRNDGRRIPAKSSERRGAASKSLALRAFPAASDSLEMPAICSKCRGISSKSRPNSRE